MSNASFLSSGACGWRYVPGDKSFVVFHSPSSKIHGYNRQVLPTSFAIHYAHSLTLSSDTVQAVHFQVLFSGAQFVVVVVTCSCYISLVSKKCWCVLAVSQQRLRDNSLTFISCTFRLTTTKLSLFSLVFYKIRTFKVLSC
jgi:hypothetical protein